MESVSMIDENQPEYYVVLFSYGENLTLQSFLIEYNARQINIKERLEYTAIQNTKLVRIKSNLFPFFNQNFLAQCAAIAKGS